MSKWVNIKLGEIASSIKGKKPKELNAFRNEDSIPYLDIRAFEKGDIRKYADTKSSRIVNEDELVMVWDGARSGWVSTGKYGALGSTLAIIKVPIVDTNYLYRFLQLKFQILNTETKGTGIPHVNPDVLWNLDFPIAPLSEQKRIADKLDKAFEYIDKVKARMETIPELVKEFRKMVLRQAISGKLTEEWRGNNIENIEDYLAYIQSDRLENEKSQKQKTQIEQSFLSVAKNNKDITIPEEWRSIDLAALVNKFTYGTSKKSNESGEVPVLRMGNLQNGKIDWNNLKYSSDPSEIEKYNLLPGDVLFNRTNSAELVGKTSIYEGERQAIYAGYIIKLDVHKDVDSNYINYVLNSQFARDWCATVQSHSAGQSNINAQKLSKFNIPITTKEEQIEIVKQIDALFLHADNIESKFKQVQVQLNDLPNQLLAKAFRGELVEPNTSDELAEVLLERIKAEMEKLKPRSKRKKK